MIGANSATGLGGGSPRTTYWCGVKTNFFKEPPPLDVTAKIIDDDNYAGLRVRLFFYALDTMNKFLISQQTW